MSNLGCNACRNTAEENEQKYRTRAFKRELEWEQMMERSKYEIARAKQAEEASNDEWKFFFKCLPFVIVFSLIYRFFH